MLKVLEKAKKNQPLEISSTFLGAHSVPKGKRAEEATKDVIQNQVGRGVRQYWRQMPFWPWTKVGLFFRALL